VEKTKGRKNWADIRRKKIENDRAEQHLRVYWKGKKGEWKNSHEKRAEKKEQKEGRIQKRR